MIIFYPRNIGKWQDHFDFNPSITLTPKAKTYYQAFQNRNEFIAFLKEHDVSLTNPNFPLRFQNWDTSAQDFPGSGDTFIVIQCDILGWFKDDYK